MPTPFPLDPTPIHVSDEVLADLRARLRATKWPLDAGNEDGHYGVRRTDLQELVAYWADGFDWRASESAINAFPNYRVDVGGVPVHFLRKAGVGPRPVPLILSHGWPWTFWHFAKVIDRLADPAAYGGDPADAFDVIVPSLPGFGFSTPLAQPDLNFWKIADVWHSLMTEVLGYSRYAAAGNDVGALVTGQLGHKYADELLGIHIGSALKLDFFNGERAWDITGGRPVPEGLSPEVRARLLEVEKRFAVHLSAHMLAPTTLAFGLSDSPAGLLAWLLERWDKWSDDDGDVLTVFSPDELLTHATIFWAGDAIETSIRTYANNNRYPWAPSHDRQPVVEAPTGITFVDYENPPGVGSASERIESLLASDRAGRYNHTSITCHPRGGHFIPWEIPEEWTDDVRRTFRTLR
ncbi:epoxide hydrolase family protein [Kribbella sp. NPDC051770]|uniref:epoxide hydrolase family protein n=1 Tax=Kribbella sp. NPDC051770 TaxID=3155413 RepID=UPI00342C1152